ncbi:MAG TPA: hemin ABC transporter substrate-binding protein [Fibrobacteria bacterium]|nr:hemin ABC transporter substrate-binding protein [Fibrobacteria bacterium]
MKSHHFLATVLMGASLLHAAPAKRIVSLGGPVTETVFALGEGGRVIAIDLSSVWPPEAAKLPKVGYHRALSAEGVLSLNPDLVLGSDEAGPPAVLDQIRAAKVPVSLVPVEYTVEAARSKILAIAKVLGKEKEGGKLVASLDADVKKAQGRVAASKARPRVLFIYARGQGTLSVSGRGTAADAMIALGGGVNAVTGYDGYKPLTPEALAAANADVILMTTRGLESVGGKTGLLAQPGVALTPAGKAGNIVALDDELLLGFGPRLGQGVLALAVALHPETRP